MADFGKNPSVSTRVSSSRLNSALIVPPTSDEPLPGTTSGDFLSFPSANMFSLAWRQAKVRALNCQASSFLPSAASR